MRVEELVAARSSIIRRMAFHFYRQQADADDLAAETIYKCLRNASSYDGRDFDNWAFTIMKNTYITSYNRRSKVLFTALSECPEVSGSQNTYDDISLIEIKAVISRLARRTVSVQALMLYVAGYSYMEIAQKFGIGIGTVKSRISAGRAVVRKALEE